MDRNLLLVVILAIFLSYMLITSGRGPDTDRMPDISMTGKVAPVLEVAVILQMILHYIFQHGLYKIFLPEAVCSV